MASILVLEDNEFLLELYKEIFSIDGHNIIAALSYKAFQQQLSISFPDLFILDVVLMDSDGREVCRQLKAGPLTQNIPVVLISASHQFLENREQYGADAILEKPFNIKDFRTLVNMLIR